MKGKKFVLIPLLIAIYLFFLSSIQSGIVSSSLNQVQKSAGAEVLGVGQTVTVTVTRPYLFGLFRLPTYSGGVYVGNIHNAFINLILLLTISFTLIEIGERRSKHGKISYASS